MDSTSAQIDSIREQWGSRLLVLGHHYQQASVLRHADERGDSLELARKAAGSAAERIVFCGVHFMAESADILSDAAQTVYMPEVGAGCPMADMADAAGFDLAWSALEQHGNWLPVVYVNSTAAIKARCGRLGGSACTSSNAAAVFRRALDQGKRVFFLPDEHLGRNTAHDLGLAPDEVAVYDPALPRGGLGGDALERARVIAWKGFCIVHVAFTAQRVREVRERLPQAKIILHPEAPREAVALADAHGSTSQIIRYVEAAPDGATIVIGTEQHLVDRLAEEQAGRVTVKCLAPSVCANMAKTNARNLLDLLEHFSPDNEIHVQSDIAADARLALERMLTL